MTYPVVANCQNVDIDVYDGGDRYLFSVKVWEHWPMRAVRMGAMAHRYVLYDVLLFICLCAYLNILQGHVPTPSECALGVSGTSSSGFPPTPGLLMLIRS